MVETRQIGAAPTALLQALGAGPMTRKEIQIALGFDWRQTTNAARSLGKRGYLDVLADGRYALSPAGQEAARAGLIITGGPKGQVKVTADTFRERAWRSIRVRKTFTIGEIVADAIRMDSTEPSRPHDNAGRYISRLRQAGYLREQGRRQRGTASGSNGFKQFILLRNTGPRAPIYREALGVIHDPNTGEDIPCRQD